MRLTLFALASISLLAGCGAAGGSTPSGAKGPEQGSSDVSSADPSSPDRSSPDRSSPDARPLPDEKLTTLEGGTAQLSEIVRGKVAVIDLWATWCTACRPVSARVAELATAHASNTDLIVVGLNVGEELPVVASFLQGKKHAHPFFLDTPLKITDDLSLKELPAIIVVDRRGRILRISRELDSKTVQVIESELAQAAPRQPPLP